MTRFRAQGSGRGHKISTASPALGAGESNARKNNLWKLIFER
jgi:hypothetical protein